MLVFLLEEPSMKVFLEGLLPRLIPEVPFRLIPHEGKTDLEKSIPRKLRGWRTPNTLFFIVRDQDSGDCVRIKKKLEALCAEAGRADSRVCIVCRELEAWFLGDLSAVGRIFSNPSLTGLQNKAKYRDPDRVGSPSRELMSLVPGYGKISGARQLGMVLDPENSRSGSFGHFVRKVCEAASAA